MSNYSKEYEIAGGEISVVRHGKECCEECLESMEEDA